MCAGRCEDARWQTGTGSTQGIARNSFGEGQASLDFSISPEGNYWFFLLPEELRAQKLAPCLRSCQQLPAEAAARARVSRGHWMLVGSSRTPQPGLFTSAQRQLHQQTALSFPSLVYEGHAATGTDFILLCLKFSFSLSHSFTHFLQFFLTALLYSFPDIKCKAF